MARRPNRTSRPSSAFANANARAAASAELSNWLRRAEDFRSWNPQTRRSPGSPTFMRIARDVDGLTRSSQLVPRPIARQKAAGGGMRKVGLQDGTRFPHFAVGFANPVKVVLCVRRKRRKQVMFATGKAGKGKKQRRRRNNEFSQIRC